MILIKMGVVEQTKNKICHSQFIAIISQTVGHFFDLRKLLTELKGIQKYGYVSLKIMFVSRSPASGASTIDNYTFLTLF